MAGTSLLHQPERLESFERQLRRLWQQAGLRRTPLVGGAHTQRFEIVRLLGRGASAVVCEARDLKWKSTVAIKLFPRESEDEGFLAVQREAKNLRLLHHENVVRVHDFDRAELQPGGLLCHWLSMDLMEGGSLRAWLGQQRGDAEILAMLRKVGEGLAYAHGKGMVHRDLKPENVMLAANEVPKLVDFGLAIASDGMLDLHTIVGTPAFMAPEALRGGRLDERSDQFSFAATLWLALCRDFPYDPASRDPDARGPFRAAPERLSPTLIACMQRALARDPDARFPTMQLLLAALYAAESEAAAPPHAVFATPPPPSYGADSESYVLRGYPSASASLPEIPPPTFARAVDPAQPPRTPWWHWSGLAVVSAGLAAATFMSVQRLGEADAPLVEADAPPDALIGKAAASDKLDVVDAQPPVTAPPLAPPPTCAIPADAGGTWLFNTAETSQQHEYNDKVGRYELVVTVAADACTVRGILTKKAYDKTTYEPPLKDDQPLEFSLLAPFAGQLTGHFRPSVPWEKGAYVYDFVFVVDGKELYGSYRARGSREVVGVLRGHRAPRAAPGTAAKIRAQQPCWMRCAVDCAPATCENRCTSSAPWALPKNCPNP